MKSSRVNQRLKKAMKTVALCAGGAIMLQFASCLTSFWPNALTFGGLFALREGLAQLGG